MLKLKANTNTILIQSAIESNYLSHPILYLCSSRIMAHISLNGIQFRNFFSTWYVVALKKMIVLRAKDRRTKLEWNDIIWRRRPFTLKEGKGRRRQTCQVDLHKLFKVDLQIIEVDLQISEVDLQIIEVDLYY